MLLSSSRSSSCASNAPRWSWHPSMPPTWRSTAVLSRRGCHGGPSTSEPVPACSRSTPRRYRRVGDPLPTWNPTGRSSSVALHNWAPTSRTSSSSMPCGAPNAVTVRSGDTVRVRREPSCCRSDSSTSSSSSNRCGRSRSRSSRADPPPRSVRNGSGNRSRERCSSRRPLGTGPPTSASSSPPAPTVSPDGIGRSGCRTCATATTSPCSVSRPNTQRGRTPRRWCRRSPPTDRGIPTARRCW